MDLTFNEHETEFRDELRAWLTLNRPGGSPDGDGRDRYAWLSGWQRRLHEGGWTGVDWPIEYGGRGATLTQSAIFFEELARARAPLPVNVLGLLLGGPTLMRWGTADQKERFLPRILSAEEIWCQGFSEPDAGSDLASLKTHAVRDGDDWVDTTRNATSRHEDHMPTANTMLAGAPSHNASFHRGRVKARVPG